MTTVSLDDNDAKDLLLDGISQSVKELQREHLLDNSYVISNESVQLQRLCQHIDQVFLCGLVRREQGYWRLVNKMTRQEALHLLDHLPGVKTALGKGRAWLYLSLSENVLESYLRALPNYGELIVDMYSKESFLRDSERMFTLTTLVTGLDFLTFELTVNCEHFDRYGLLPAATNCGLSYEYTSMSVEASNSFRAVHSPIKERSDPLAAGGSGRSWVAFKGYLSKQADKLTGGSTGASAAQAIPGSPPSDEATLSQSLTSSLSSLKFMASRLTGGHNEGLSRPDYKEIAAIIPGSEQAQPPPQAGTASDVSSDSSANTLDKAAQNAAEQSVLSQSMPPMGVATSSSSPLSTGTDSANSCLPPLYISSQDSIAAKPADAAEVASRIQRSSSLGAGEAELTGSVEGGLTSSGTFKTRTSTSTRRLDFGRDDVDGLDGEEDDDVEVIQISKKTKRGKKKKKKAQLAVIASPREISEEDERAEETSRSRSSTTPSAETTDGGLSHATLATSMMELQRLKMHGQASKPLTEGQRVTSSVAEPTPATVSTSLPASTATQVTTAASSSAFSNAGDRFGGSGSYVQPASTQPAVSQAGPITTGTTPTHQRLAPSTNTANGVAARSSLLSSSLPMYATSASTAPLTSSSLSESRPGAGLPASTSTSTADASHTPPSAVTPPVRRSIYDNFDTEAVTSSPITHDRQSSPVPIAELIHDDDMILSPSQSAPKPDNASSFSLAEYEESDFARSGHHVSSVGDRSAADTHKRSQQSSAIADSAGAAAMSVSTTSGMPSAVGNGHQSAVAAAVTSSEGSSRPASTRSNQSGGYSSSQSDHVASSHGHSPAVHGPGTPSDHEQRSSSRGYRSASRGSRAGSSPSLMRRVSKTTTPSLVADEDGEQIPVVELSQAMGSGSVADSSDMLPALQRSKEALLEERNYPIPERPSLSDAKADAHDMPADHNLQLMFSLKIFKVSSNENLIRMMRVQTSAGRGKFKVTMAAISNFAFYIVNMDGTEGKYNRELCFPYKNFDHIEICLNWQAITIICRNEDQQTIITGNEPVTRGLVKSLIRAAQSAGVQAPRIDARDRDRLQTLERYIEGLDSEDAVDSEFTIVTSPDSDFRVLRYSIVHWEQLDGKASQSLFATSTAVVMEGPIHYRTTMVGISYWTEGYAVLRNGTFFLYGKEETDEPTVFIQLWGTHCGGCRRLNLPDRSNCFEVKSTSDSLTLSVEKEEDIMSWLQGICEVVAGTMGSSAQAHCVQCSMVITPNKNKESRSVYKFSIHACFAGR